jgi:Adaptor complexes medium subunit family
MLLQPSWMQSSSAPHAACALAQVFLDVVESVNLLVNSNGTVVRSEVVGALKMRTYLSGMPECKLGLNDKVGPGPWCSGNASDRRF